MADSRSYTRMTTECKKNGGTNVSARLAQRQLCGTRIARRPKAKPRGAVNAENAAEGLCFLCARCGLMVGLSGGSRVSPWPHIRSATSSDSERSLEACFCGSEHDAMLLCQGRLNMLTMAVPRRTPWILRGARSHQGSAAGGWPLVLATTAAL